MFNKFLICFFLFTVPNASTFVFQLFLRLLSMLSAIHKGIYSLMLLRLYKKICGGKLLFVILFTYLRITMVQLLQHLVVNTKVGSHSNIITYGWNGNLGKVRQLTCNKIKRINNLKANAKPNKSINCNT